MLHAGVARLSFPVERLPCFTNRYRLRRAVLQPGMGPILHALFEEDHLIIKDIVERTQVTHGRLTPMLARMEKSGLIQRSRDGEDGRAVRVRLTPRGRALKTPMRRLHKAIMKELHQGLDEQDMRRAQDLIIRISDAIARSHGKTPARAKG